MLKILYNLKLCIAQTYSVDKQQQISGVDQPSVDSTPSRKRSTPQQFVESPRKRRHISTPVRQALQSSIVEKSPAVAVSVN